MLNIRAYRLKCGRRCEKVTWPVGLNINKRGARMDEREILEMALKGYEHQRNELEGRISAIRWQMATGNLILVELRQGGQPAKAKKIKRSTHVSKAGRERI